MSKRESSSLPSSLIPHLYSRPEDPTFLPPLEPVLNQPAPLRSAPPFERHRQPFTNRGHDPDTHQQRAQHHLYHHATSNSQSQMSERPPPFPLPPLQIWREGEPGPSSLLHPISTDVHHATHRRGSSQPLRPTDTYRRSFAQPDPHRQSAERDTYRDRPSFPREFLHPTRSYDRLPGPSHLLNPSPDEPNYFDRPYDRDPYPYPAVGSLSISAPSPTFARTPESPDTTSLHRSDSRSADLGSNDGDGSHKGKRRREESVETDDNAKKSRNPRKTSVACNFCRGRKLRCNGEKPSCYNCTVRKFECEYVPVQRRRGPGKAPKGSRSKKVVGGTRSDPSGSSSQGFGDRPSSMVPEYELDALAPEVRPYTSVLSLDNFGFQPPPPSPQYPSAHDAHYYYSRTRTSRSRETSSEDRSDAERNV